MCRFFSLCCPKKNRKPEEEVLEPCSTKLGDFPEEFRRGYRNLGELVEEARKQQEKTI